MIIKNVFFLFSKKGKTLLILIYFRLLKNLTTNNNEKTLWSVKNKCIVQKYTSYITQWVNF